MVVRLNPVDYFKPKPSEFARAIDIKLGRGNEYLKHLRESVAKFDEWEIKPPSSPSRLSALEPQGEQR